MLLPKSICVRIPCSKSVTPSICIAKVHFSPFFLGGGGGGGGGLTWSYTCTYNIPQSKLIQNIYGFMV